MAYNLIVTERADELRYREALFQKMNYRVVFRIDEQAVYVMGVLEA